VTLNLKMFKYRFIFCEYHSFKEIHPINLYIGAECSYITVFFMIFEKKLLTCINKFNLRSFGDEILVGGVLFFLLMQTMISLTTEAIKVKFHISHRNYFESCNVVNSYGRDKKG